MVVNNSTNINEKNDHLSPQQYKNNDIWRWKSRSWFRIGTTYGGLNQLMGSQPLLIIGYQTTIKI
jgi:hypothetical protein